MRHDADLEVRAPQDHERHWSGALPAMLSYLLFIATIGGIYGLLALSLNLIWGGVGMVNLGLAGFFAVGAYASALLTTAGHAPIAVGWLAALVAGGAAGLVVTLSTTRLREDYLAIVTLGFAEVVRLVAANEIWLTRGSDGISGIPGPWKAALGPAFNAVYFVIVVAALADRVLRGAPHRPLTLWPRLARDPRGRPGGPGRGQAGAALQDARPSRCRPRSRASPARSTAISHRTSRPTSSCR